jgi:4'-phosphopantetheinyl transferase
VLSPDELERAERMVEPAAQRFIASRTLLRTVLSSYLPAAPDEIDFSTRCAHCSNPDHGKPTIALPRPTEPFSFSVSRTRGRVVVAVARQPVGVDVEVTRAREHLCGVARRLLSDRERDDTTTTNLSTEAFYRLWTGKEAYLKAIGMGMARALSDISLIGPDDRAWYHVDDAQRTDWSGAVLALETGDGYAASLAVMGGPVRVHRFDAADRASAGRLS